MNNKKNVTIAAADIGATHVRSAVFTDGGKGEMQCLVHRKEALCRDGPDGSVVTRQVIRMIREVCDDAGISPDAVGISTAGPLSSGKKSIRMGPNMPYPDIPLREPLEVAFSCPVFILNDASAGAYYEYRIGDGYKNEIACQNLVYLTLSTGIGCGILSDGHLLEGLDGNAGEAGHFCVDTHYNLPCGCGGRGHWEAYASGSGIPQFYRSWCREQGQGISAADTVTAESLCAAARAGDPMVMAFFRDLAVINGRGFSTIIAAYAPEKIVVGGPVATENPDLIVVHARDHIDRYLPVPKILLSTADGMAPLRGAAMFAEDSLADLHITSANNP